MNSLLAPKQKPQVDSRSHGGRTTARYLPAHSYATAHLRVKKLWGPAKQYLCIRCGKQACDWAYDWCDPSTDKDFSGWPEFYMPMCRGCHRHYDRVACHAVIKNITRYAYYEKNDYDPDRLENPQTEAEWDAWSRRRR